jgi:hypothetical protein
LAAFEGSKPGCCATVNKGKKTRKNMGSVFMDVQAIKFG